VAAKGLKNTGLDACGAIFVSGAITKLHFAFYAFLCKLLG